MNVVSSVVRRGQEMFCGNVLPLCRHIVKHGVQWSGVEWSGFVKGGFVKGRFVKGGFVKP